LFLGCDALIAEVLVAERLDRRARIAQPLHDDRHLTREELSRALRAEDTRMGTLDDLLNQTLKRIFLADVATSALEGLCEDRRRPQ
jgi:hypothetical protein